MKNRNQKSMGAVLILIVSSLNLAACGLGCEHHRVKGATELSVIQDNKPQIQASGVTSQATIYPEKGRVSLSSDGALPDSFRSEFSSISYSNKVGGCSYTISVHITSNELDQHLLDNTDDLRTAGQSSLAPGSFPAKMRVNVAGYNETAGSSATCISREAIADITIELVSVTSQSKILKAESDKLYLASPAGDPTMTFRIQGSVEVADFGSVSYSDEFTWSLTEVTNFTDSTTGDCS